MNKFYVIFPAVLLLVFAVYYIQVAKPEMAEQEAAAKQKSRTKRQADAARRADIEKRRKWTLRCSNMRERSGTA